MVGCVSALVLSVLDLVPLLAMVALRTGQDRRPQLGVEAAAAYELPAGHQGLFDAMRRRWVIGDPETAHARIEALASRFELDEVMIDPVAGAPADSAPDRSPAREQTLRLLVE
jgi:alkanesulfonate monooxygenase SsuD/methylene tetrahydromethanopterin reductase-like flavin-dependent oxidoreductase (luciferase family)